MKHTMKKLLILVLAMMLALGAVSTAFAANDPTSVEAYLSKTYNAEKGHAFDFVFEATQDTTTEGYVYGNVPLTIGDNNKISFTEGETGTTKKVAKLNFGDFTAAGRYRYVVKETGVDPTFTPSENEKLIMSKAEYEVLVYVQQVTNKLKASNDPADYKIAAIVVNQIKNNAGEDVHDGGKVDIGPIPETNSFNFENTYVYEAGVGPNPGTPTPEYSTNGSLLISKEVVHVGNDAQDKTDNTVFDFKVNFTFPAGTDEKTLGGIKANGNPVSLTNGNEYSFQLKDKESMRFNELPVGTKFTVVETGTLNYKGYAVITIDTTKTEERAMGYGDDLTVSEKKLSANSNKVEVGNIFMDVPPMGIIINMLPYVVMFAIGGAALMMFIVFKNRRNNAEEE